MWGFLGFRRFLAIVSVALVAACASAPRPGVNHDRVITSTELRSSANDTMYEAIDRLRPAWLGGESVGRSGTTRPSVYMNRLYLGGPGELERVRVRDVVEVRLISPRLALDRYGADNPAGAIEVVTRDVGAY